MHAFPVKIRFGSFVVLLLLIAHFNSSAQNKDPKKAYMDSIVSVISTMPDDTHKVNYINTMYDSTLWMLDSPEAYNQLKYAARLANQLNYYKGEYRSYHNMAGYCVRANAHDYALQNRAAAVEVARSMNDTVRMNGQWAGMAMSFSGLGQHELAIQYYEKALPFIRAQNNIERLGRTHTFMGWAYHAMDNDSMAIYYCELGRSERQQAKHYPEGVMATNGSLWRYYAEQKQYDKAHEVLMESLLIQDTLHHEAEMVNVKMALGELAMMRGNLDSAYFYFRLGVEYAEAHGNELMKRSAYLNMATVLEKMGRKAEAYDFLTRYNHLNDSIRNWETQNNLARAREIYDVESKNKEIEKLQQETELAQLDLEKKERQRMWLIAIAGVTTLLVLISLIAYRNKRNSARKLREQKHIIEEKNRDITDSIVYAQRIQKAILPSLQQIKDALPESFVFFRPKDIVSGDFFWFNETPWSYYLAVVDCTGHGVPGAMMSLIGYNFLGQIVNEKDIEQPAEILNELHRKVLLALNKDFTTRDIKDGMDVALLRIDKKTGKIYYAGAVRPVYIVLDGQLTELKGDIYSIGGIKDAQTESFTQHEIDAPEGTCIYLFSDGFADQFGGPKGKKYKYKQLRELLTNNSSRPMTAQFSEVQRTFEQWKGTLEQVDDVCVVGLRIGAPKP